MMLLTWILFTFIVVKCAGDEALSGNPTFLGYFTQDDKRKLRMVFSTHIDSGKDLDKQYFTALGYSSLGDKLINMKCPAANMAFNEPSVVFYSTYVAKLLSTDNCHLAVNEVEKFTKSKLVEGISAEDLFYTVTSMKNMGIPVDTNAIIQLIRKMKTNSLEPFAMGFLFQVISQLGLPQSDVKNYLSDVEDVLQQADQIDGNKLFYGRGLYTTALITKGVVDVLNAYGQVPQNMEERLVKLFNYLYKHRHITNVRAAAHLASAFSALSRSSIMVPVAIEQLGKLVGLPVPQDSSVLQYNVVHIWNGSVYTTDDLKIKGLQLLKKGFQDHATVAVERGEFKGADQNRVFQLSLASDSSSSPVSGFYELTITAKLAKPKANQKLLGLDNVQVPIHILTKIKVSEASFLISDKLHDRPVADIILTPDKLHKASTPSGAITIESGMQISMRFRLREQNLPNRPVTAHQVFVILTHQKTQQVITFTCKQASATGQKVDATDYQLYLDLEASAVDFDHISGVYTAELIVGDTLIQNPLIWHMADLDLHFGGEEGSESTRRANQARDVSRLRSSSVAGAKYAPGPKSFIGMGPTSAQPEIEHVFRPPEPRAPRTLALVFTALCLAPLLIVLIFWVVIGFNLSNFKFSISSIIFHTGLIAIFCLYAVYWIRLDMFTTLGYLAVLGVPTFVAGSSVLRTQASLRQRSVGK